MGVGDVDVRAFRGTLEEGGACSPEVLSTCERRAARLGEGGEASYLSDSP